MGASPGIPATLGFGDRFGLLLGGFGPPLNFRDGRHVVFGETCLVSVFGTMRLFRVWAAHPCFGHRRFLLPLRRFLCLNGCFFPFSSHFSPAVHRPGECRKFRCRIPPRLWWRGRRASDRCIPLRMQRRTVRRIIPGRPHRRTAERKNTSWNPDGSNSTSPLSRMQRKSFAFSPELVFAVGKKTYCGNFVNKKITISLFKTHPRAFWHSGHPFLTLCLYPSTYAIFWRNGHRHVQTAVWRKISAKLSHRKQSAGSRRTLTPTILLGALSLTLFILLS